ncbi:MAG: glycosyltransferase [Eubacterium sp.]|nr:glycosyltransferase [Eubacterium sp.]
MKILIYHWKAYNYIDIIETFRQMGHEVNVFKYPLEHYDDDPVFARLLAEKLDEAEYDFVFTVNYFAVISEVCQEKGRKYVVWTCDNPLISMYHQAVFYPCNYFFTFDKTNYYEFRQMGVKQIWHLPLTANAHRIQAILQQFPAAESSGTDIGSTGGGSANEYKHDITFVGSLYERNTYDKIEHRLPEYLRGYLEGTIQAQMNISGGNIIGKMLTPDIMAQLETYFTLEKSEKSFSNLNLIFGTTVLGFKVAAEQRIELLNMLSKKHRVSVYSNSNLSCLPFCEACGSADYWTKLPQVFVESKINLNLTIPNIKSGIPLRVWDVLASGGFLMTNYQVEILDYFEPDRDLVIFESPEELEKKVSYYLEHEEEREQIARNGKEKLVRYHPYNGRLQKMLSTVFEK